MKQKFIWLLLGAIVLFGLSYFYKISHKSLHILKIDERVLSVEIVSTPEAITNGLSGRSEIGSDGMLFIFPNKQKLVFWMKEMKFPLDIIWIADGKVVEITRDVPPPEGGVPFEALPRYSPDSEVDMVLEVNAGFANENNLGVGSSVILVK